MMAFLSGKTTRRRWARRAGRSHTTTAEFKTQWQEKRRPRNGTANGWFRQQLTVARIADGPLKAHLGKAGRRSDRGASARAEGLWVRRSIHLVLTVTLCSRPAKSQTR